MSRSMRTNLSRRAPLLMALALLIFAAGCKKKPPPPPPPPPVPLRRRHRPRRRPLVSSFTAEPSTIEKGQAARCAGPSAMPPTWPSIRALARCRAKAAAVFPTATTTYTLSVHWPGGDDSETATVDQSPSPPPPPPPSAAQTAYGGTEHHARDVQDVYFDYDKNDIRSEAQGVLTA